MSFASTYITFTAASRPQGKLEKLECLRGAAAAYVFLTHAFSHLSGPSRWFLRFGPEAVMLFFVLSGFVIYYSTFRTGRVPTFAMYLARRFRRIYSVFFVALLAGVLHVELSARSPVNPWTWQLLGNVLMLQDNIDLKPGVFCDTYGDNSALWSLSYEWWFYMMFYPLVALLPLSFRGQTLTAFAVTALGFASYQWHPQQLGLFTGYFFLWWAGASLAHEFLNTGRVTWSGQRLMLSLLAVTAILWGLPVLLALRDQMPLRPGVNPVLQFRHAAATLGVVLVGIAWNRVEFFGFSTAFRWFLPLAPISYSLYLFHIPALAIIRDLFPDWRPLGQIIAAIAILIPACTLVEVVGLPQLARWSNRLAGRTIGAPAQLH